MQNVRSAVLGREDFLDSGTWSRLGFLTTHKNVPFEFHQSIP